METKNTEQEPEAKKCRFCNIKAGRWIRFSIAALVYIAFTIWVGNYYLLLGLLLLVDIYLTKYIPWGFWRKSKNKVFRKTMEWIDAILYALVAVYLINTFIFQNYQIPTSSLEKSLLVGDYLFVSKMSYGPRVPNTPLSFPLAQHTLPIVNTKSYIDWPQWEYKRLKGFGKVKRNDIVVFNFPAGDSVAVNVPNPDYYTICYQEGHNSLSNVPNATTEQIYAAGREIVKANKAQYGEIVYRPVDRRENYVKRAIGLPGDTFQVKNNQVYIDGKAIKNPKEMQQNYFVMTNGARFVEKNFRDLNISVDDRADVYNEYLLKELGFKPNEQGIFNPVYHFPLTQEMLEKVKKLPFVTDVKIEPGYFGGESYPLGYGKDWTRSDFGPIWIPKKGETITITTENLPIYERAIRDYEKNQLRVEGQDIYINGVKTNKYTFNMDYYMMLGDNRDNSADSRFWGFVPEDHVVGKPLFIWLSLDKDRGLFDGFIRFKRLFTSVKSE